MRHGFVILGAENQTNRRIFTRQDPVLACMGELGIRLPCIRERELAEQVAEKLAILSFRSR
jgi:hypothetical protein